jgi:hypothetical protein
VIGKLVIKSSGYDPAVGRNTVDPTLEKGGKEGPCGRTACTRRSAQWFNHITRLYYCRRCAALINESSRNSGLGDLCSENPAPPTREEE